MKDNVTRQVKALSHGAFSAKFLIGEIVLCEAWYAPPNLRKISVPEQKWIDLDQARLVHGAMKLAADWLKDQYVHEVE